MLFEMCELDERWVMMSELPYEMYLRVLRDKNRVEDLYVAEGINTSAILNKGEGWFGQLQQGAKAEKVHEEVQNYVDYLQTT